ncbi:unnamed protein product, partial [Ectocarpus fasciculatus]
MCGDNNEAKGDILLCDSCDAEYHLSCCTPPLKVCPEGEWFCLTCRKNRGEPVTKLFNEVRSARISEEDKSFCSWWFGGGLAAACLLCRRGAPRLLKIG